MVIGEKMDAKELKKRVFDASKNAYDVLDDSSLCDGIYDCDKSCPYFGNADESGFHCIIVQATIKLERIIKISEKK